MSKYSEMASTIIQCVGGKENISNAFHCMTRLRFNFKDKSLVNADEVKKISGVLGVELDADDDLQIIIGPDVNNLYKEVIRQTGIEESSQIEENLDGPKEKFSIKGVFKGIMNAFAASMNPLVPVFVLIGTMNVVAALIGPNFLKLVAEDSAIYTNFYYVSQAIIYFLPVLLAVTASKHFKTNTYLSLVLAFVLVYPDFITAISTGTYTVFGLPVTVATYTSSVLPIILIVWIQHYVEKLVDKIVPNALKVIGSPFLTIAIMLPLALCVLGPAGTILGGLIAQLIVTLNQVAGPIETMLVGALGLYMVAFGIGRPAFFICMSMLFANGVEYAYMPIAMALTNFVAMGLALGYAIKAKGSDKKQLGITSFVACALGGVSEPTIFGIFLPNKKTILPAVIGGGVAGLLIGLFKVGYYQFGPSNVLSVIGFIGGNSNNFLFGCISCAVALILTCVLMCIMYKSDEDKSAK